jgi:hypothetical protein
MNNLGTLVGQVEALIQGYEDFMYDPITIQSSCGDEFAPGVWKRIRREVEELVQAAGFRNTNHFIDVVSRRTSEKYVYLCTSLLSLQHGAEVANA